MDGRERWQALQAHLSAARRALNDGDRARAAAEVNAALAIDPEFAAARALQDRIDLPEPPLRAPAEVAAPTAAEAGPRRTIDVPKVIPIRVAAAPRPLVSAEGFARFEERARRRRIERRAEAARTALVNGNLREARSAIDEIRDLDPDSPEILTLLAAVDAARRVRAERPGAWHLGPQLVAAAVFATIVLAASWVERPRGLLSYPISIVMALVTTAQPAPLIATSSSDEEPPVGTFGATTPDLPGIAAKESDVKLPRSSSGVIPSEIAPSISPAPPPSAASTTPGSTTIAPSIPATLAASLPAPSPVAAPPPAVAPPPVAETPVAELKAGDDVLVRHALLQYKSAYEALDARSAHAVWPVVNERALARAFDGLESQHLLFDTCDVQVNGDGAAAICRGTARYVAKIGSREPRTEPRVWNFTLRKTGQDWKIESARAER